MPRTLETPSSPEAWCHRVQHLLKTLRDHKKHNETILDDIFFQTVSFFNSNFDFDAQPENADTATDTKEYKKACKTMSKLSKQIMKKNPKEPGVYIEFFEALVVTMPEAKTCVDCGIHFHPSEHPERRTHCLSCM